MEKDLIQALTAHPKQSESIEEFRKARGGNMHRRRKLQLFNIKFPPFKINFNTTNQPIEPTNHIYRINMNGFFLYPGENIRT